MSIYVSDDEGGSPFLDKITKRICVQLRIRTSKMVKTLFDISQKWILNQTDEIFGISTIELKTVPWVRTTMLHDGAVKLAKAKVHVYSDSVLCLGKIHEHPQSIDVWKQHKLGTAP